MCHLILMMPLFGLGLFYILPLAWALPLYGALLVVSGLLYFLIYRAHRLPVACGAESMVGKRAQVLESFQGRGIVRYQNILWKARSREPLEAGKRVTIKEVKGMTLLVQRGAHLDAERKPKPTAACHR